MADIYDYFKKEPYPITLKNFPSFINGTFDRVAVGGRHSLVLKSAVPGVRAIMERDIDVLRQYPYLKTVTVTGLHQDTFEYFVRKFGTQFHAIRFEENPMVEDWSRLGRLNHLSFLCIRGNRHLTSLWDMSYHDHLQGLSLIGVPRLANIEGIEQAKVLKYLHMGDALSLDASLSSLAVLKHTGIEHLTYMGKLTEDSSLSFVADMPRLKEFHFPTNLYTTRQVAWMVANYPDVQGLSLAPMLETNKCVYGTNTPAVQIVGKKKPLLIRAGNEAKIAAYQKQFDALVEKYKGRPYHAVLDDMSESRKLV